MKVELETRKECDVIDEIVLSYESNKRIIKNDRVDKVMSSLRSSISSYHIGNIDKIGIMICKFCAKEWTAICSDKSKSLVCPNCNKRNEMPIFKER